jgi:hypothetical protein
MALEIRSKAFLYATLISCTVLATQVGPASAMIFTPAQLWIKATSTHFYIAGMEDVLWLATLTSNDNGSNLCRQSPLHVEYSSCLYGSWRVLPRAITILRSVRHGFRFYIPEGGAYKFPPSALIYGNMANPERNFTSEDPDTWAATSYLGVASHMDYLNQHTMQAFWTRERMGKDQASGHRRESGCSYNGRKISYCTNSMHCADRNLGAAK